MNDDEFAPMIERLDAFPARVAGLAQRFDAASARRRLPEGGFSLVEQLCHLRDIEREGYVERIRRIVSEDMPELTDLDGTTLAAERDYQSQDAATALREWTEARRASARLLREHLPAQAGRTGVFGGFGVITLAMLVQGMGLHDAGHWKELKALAEAFAASPA